jgi:hypothetical protein
MKMPPEREIIENGIDMMDRTLWGFIAMVIFGTVGRILISDEPFILRRFIGELLLGFVAAVMLYAAGLLQGFTPLQLTVVGGLAGLGGVRVIEWIIKIAKKVKEAS